MSRRCASTDDVCKLRIHVFKTTNGQEQNYESTRPNYEKVLDSSQGHISKLRIRISRRRTKIFRPRLEVLNLECSDYEWTKDPATKPKFAWAKNNHETTKLAGVQYVACPVTSVRNPLSTAGNSMTSSERPSPEPLLKKETPPAVLGVERILEMLWKPQMPLIVGFGGSQPYSRREFQETL